MHHYGLKNAVAVAAVFAAFAIVRSFAVEIAPFTLTSARSGALGGTHAALADDFSALFSNPAGFVSARQELSVAELTIKAHGPLFDLIDATNSFMQSGTLDLSGLVGPRGLRTGLDVAGPLSFGFVGKGLGFGVFNRTSFDAAAIGVDITAMVSEDLLLTGGYAFRFAPAVGHELAVGFLAKGFLRGSTELESSVLTVNDLFTGDILSTRPFVSTAGVGLDLGIRYEFARTFALAVVGRDAYSPGLVTTYGSINDFLNGGGSPSAAYGTVDPRLDVGILYTPRFSLLERYFSGIVLALDYRDILDLLSIVPRNPILNIAVGAEIVFLDVLSLRAGIGDGLPSLGFGLDMRFMRVDFTMRGVEYGLDPGWNPVFAMDLGLLFRY